MTKKVKKIITSLAFCVAISACVGGVATTGLTVSASGTSEVVTGLTYDDFKVLGASVRLKESEVKDENSGESGIRFAVGVTKSAYETYQNEITTNLHLLIMPKLLVNGDLEKGEKNGEAEAYDTAVSGVWEESEQFEGYMQSFVYVKTIPAGYYDLELSARAYWDATTPVYCDTVNRSFEWVADAALDSGLYPNDTQVLESYLTEKEVTFAECTGIDAQSVKYGKVATKPATDPEKSEADFTGWYKDEACETVYDFASEITADTVIYAGWREWATVSGKVVSDTYNYNGTDYSLFSLDYTKASVTLIDSEGAETNLAVDANGAYSTKVQNAGEYTLKVTYPNYYDETATIIVGDNDIEQDLTVSRRAVNAAINGKWANQNWSVNGSAVTSKDAGANQYSYFDGMLVSKDTDFVLQTEMYAKQTTTGQAGFIFVEYDHAASFKIVIQNNQVQFVNLHDSAYSFSGLGYNASTESDKVLLTIVKNNSNYFVFANGNFVACAQADATLKNQNEFVIAPYANNTQAVFDNYFYSENAELGNAMLSSLKPTEKTLDGDLSDWNETNWTGAQADAVRASQVSATSSTGSLKAMSYLGTDGVYLAIELEHTNALTAYTGTDMNWWESSYVTFFINGTTSATMKSNGTHVDAVHQNRLISGYTKGNVIAKIVTVEKAGGGYTTTMEVFVPWAMCDNYSAYQAGDMLRMGFDCNFAGTLRPNGEPDKLASQYYLTANGLTTTAPNA